MHMDMSEKPFHARIYRKHAAPQDRDAEFVRACTVEMHMGILEEPFIREFTGEMPRPRS